jgi:hypothetical protein
MAVAEDARKCVVFFAKRAPPKPGAKPSDGPDEVEYGGTGFLVLYEEADGFESRYIVTCRHVAKHLDVDFFVRLNTLSGKAELAPVETAGWQFHDDESVDIAVAGIALDGLKYDHLTASLANRVDRTGNLACGQRIHIIGLFRLHFGEKRNVPIVHTGHIAALADSNEKIPIEDRTTGEKVLSESYLVEAQTLEGLSGSPVFIQEYVNWKAKGIRQGIESDISINAFGQLRFLGVYQGAWDGQPGTILANDRNLRGGHRVPLGMGLVTPIEKVVELIERNSILKEDRELLKARDRARRAAKMDSAFSSPASDANPKHQEDFTFLVNSAARKREQED